MPETPKQLINRAIRVLGYTQAELASLVGRSQQSISRLLKGEPADPLVIEKIHWLLAKQDALNSAAFEQNTRIDWCKPSYKMDPPAFLEHLPWCGDCQSAVLKHAGYLA